MTANRDLVLATVAWAHDVAAAERAVMRAARDAAGLLDMSEMHDPRLVRAHVRALMRRAVAALEDATTAVYVASRRATLERLRAALPTVGLREAKVQTAGALPLDADEVARRVAATRKAAAWNSNARYVTTQAERRALSALQAGLSAGDGPADLEARVESAAIESRDWRRWVRTETQRFNNAGIMDSARANSDVVGSVQVLATLDTTTCVECAALDGRTFAVDEAPALPRHPNCRCTLSPILRSADEIERELGVELDKKTRSRLDGQAADRVSYSQWLSSVDADTRRRALGDERAALYDKGVGVRAFVDDKGREVDVSDLGKGAVKALVKKSDELDREVAHPVATTAAPLQGDLVSVRGAGGYEASAKAWRKSLSRDERSAILEWTDNSDGMRRAQLKGRTGGHAARQAATLEAALRRAPKYDGTVYRGLALTDKNKAAMKDLKRTGTVFETKAMASWSRNKFVAENFTYGADDVVMRLQNKSGVDITKVGGMPSEEEVLAPSRVKYRVTGVHWSSEIRDVTYVDVEEVRR